jgi:hypothetical protein
MIVPVALLLKQDGQYVVHIKSKNVFHAVIFTYIFSYAQNRLTIQVQVSLYILFTFYL